MSHTLGTRKNKCESRQVIVGQHDQLTYDRVARATDPDAQMDEGGDTRDDVTMYLRKDNSDDSLAATHDSTN